MGAARPCLRFDVERSDDDDCTIDQGAAASLPAIAIGRRCTTTGIGTGQSANGSLAQPSAGPRPAARAARWSRSSATARSSRARSSRSRRKAASMTTGRCGTAGARLWLGRRLGRPTLGLRLGRLGTMGPDHRDDHATIAAKVLAIAERCHGPTCCSCAVPISPTRMSPSVGHARRAASGTAQLAIDDDHRQAQFPTH